MYQVDIFIIKFRSWFAFVVTRSRSRLLEATGHSVINVGNTRLRRLSSIMSYIPGRRTRRTLTDISGPPAQFPDEAVINISVNHDDEIRRMNIENQRLRE